MLKKYIMLKVQNLIFSSKLKIAHTPKCGILEAHRIAWNGRWIGRCDLLALSAFSWVNSADEDATEKGAVAVAIRSSTYICFGELHPSVRDAVRWIRLHDRKSVSGCRLAPRVSALVRRRMASGEAVCRKKGREGKKEKKDNIYTRPGREIPSPEIDSIGHGNIPT